jgi:hypothetical protein
LADKIRILESIVNELSATNISQNNEIKKLSNYIHSTQQTSYINSSKPRPQSMFSLSGGGGMSTVFPVVQSSPSTSIHTQYHSTQPTFAQPQTHVSPESNRSNLSSAYNSDASFHQAPTPISSTPNSSAVMMTRSTSFPSHLSASASHIQQQQQQQSRMYFKQQQLNQQRDHQFDSISPAELSGYSSPNSSFEKRVMIAHGSPSPCGGRPIELVDPVLSNRTSTSSFAAIAPVVAQAQWLLSQNVSRSNDNMQLKSKN